MTRATMPSETIHSRSSISLGVLAVLVALVALVAAMVLLATPPLHRQTHAAKLGVPEQPAPAGPPVSYLEHDTSVPDARVVFEGREMPVEDVVPTF